MIKTYCRILGLTIALFFCSIAASTLQAQDVVVYDYMVMSTDVNHTILRIAQNGEDFVLRKLTKDEKGRNITPILEIIKEGWELTNSMCSGSMYYFYLRKVDQAATEAANK
jgi:hypothetical protein